MKLRQLKYFSVVSELESITKAASRLHIAQPALSRQMRALERDLGVRLFAREGRGIVLTNAGQVFRDRVRTLLRELDRTKIEVMALSRSPGGRVDFGMPYSISQALTRVLVHCVHQELPDISLRVIDGWTGFIIEWLLRGKLDLGIIYDHTLASDVLCIEPLAAEEHYLVCAPGDPLARRKSVSLDSVAALPMVLPSREHGLRVAVEQSLQSIGRTPEIRMELESVVGLKQFAHQRGWYTILPRGEIEEELAAGRLAKVRISPKIYRTLSVAWSNERPTTPQIQAVQAMIKRETAKLIEQGTWGSTFLA